MKIKVNHEILRWARTTINLSIEEVAQLMNKNVQTITSWEEGNDSPTYSQMEKLAYQVLKRPMAVFFFPAPPKEDLPRKAFRTFPDFEYEKLPSTVIKLFRTAQAMQVRLGELCDDKNPSEKQIFKDITIDQNKVIEKTAANIRRYLGITLNEQISWKTSDIALKNWRKAIEDNGIFVFKEAFKQDDISGFCFYDNEFPIIFINNSMPKTRQVFTLFHELAHLLFKTGGIDKLVDDYIDQLTNECKYIEIFCNAFAAEFLVPTDDFKKQIQNKVPTDELFLRLSQRYQVSREVILRKMLDRGIVKQDFYEERAKEWITEAKLSKQQLKGGGNYYLTKITYLGETYLNVVFKEYYRNRITIHQVADYLNVKVNNVPSLEAAFIGSDTRV